MEYSPPPLFKQGISATVRLVIFVAISLALLVVDARMQSLTAVRQVVSVALYPLERAVLIPRNAWRTTSEYLKSSQQLVTDNRALRAHAAEQSQQALHASQMEAENKRLRALLNLKQQSAIPLLAAEVLSDARDPYSESLIINRGSRDGVVSGAPVVDDAGVMGQITRVMPFESQVTLITDKEQAVPVQVVRNGIRSVAVGSSQRGALELRFMPAAADLQEGDLLVTSGLDGVYPPGLPVARITRIERRADTAFSKVICKPVAGVKAHRHLLVVQTPVAPATAAASTPATREAKR
jgi:rod shape-determining protein MreC